MGEPNSIAAIIETLGNASVKNTSKTLNRHGLTGATGTEKQKTIQVLSEQLFLLAFQ
jgi:hypothetical protein